MPKGVYERTEKHRKAISKVHEGREYPWLHQRMAQKYMEEHFGGK